MPASVLACGVGVGALPRRILYSQRHRARPYVCRSQSQGGHEPITEPQRGIFQMSPQCGEATLQDARDALEICSHVNGRYKQECYAQFGCDGQRVEQYFGAVEVLENAWEQSEDVEDDDEYVDDCKPWPWTPFNKS